MFRQFLVLL